MNSDKHEVKLEGLKNQYENCLSSVKYLDQSILKITRPDDYENELNLRNIAIPLLNL